MTAMRVFDPSALKGPAKGKQNEVMVLGTAHLAQLPSTFLPASLELLKEQLADFGAALNETSGH
jgi:hypothetical protein